MDQGELFAFFDTLPTQVVVFARKPPTELLFANLACSKRWKCIQTALDRIARGTEQERMDLSSDSDSVQVEMEGNESATNWRISRTEHLTILSLTYPKSSDKANPFSAATAIPPPSPHDQLDNNIPSWVNNLPTGLFRTDVNYNLVWVNRCFRIEIGLDDKGANWLEDESQVVPVPSEEELAGRIQDLEALAEFRERLITTQIAQEIEFRWDMKDGAGDAWAYVRVVPESINGVVVGFNGIISS